MTEKDETEAAIYNQIVELEAIELHKLGQIIKKSSHLILVFSKQFRPVMLWGVKGGVIGEISLL